MLKVRPSPPPVAAAEEGWVLRPLRDEPTPRPTDLRERR
jgi:hypothetical protein